MAQIIVFGHIAEEPVPKQGQTGNAYVCFTLQEHMGKGRWQTYQVWMWGSNVHRMTRLKMKSGSLIWVTGKLGLVDSTVNHGKTRTKILKVYCSDFGYVPKWRHDKADTMQLTGIADTEDLLVPEEIDGDRMPLPE